jgi:hypothetical protein
MNQLNCCRDHALIIKLLIIKTVFYVIIRLIRNKNTARIMIEGQIFTQT